jgi:hypothetical protein
VSTTQRLWETFGFLIRFMTGQSEGATKLPASGYYYGYINAQGREFLASELHHDDPLSLPASEIVERVLAAGYFPYLASEQRFPIEVKGKCETVERADQRFIVAIDRTTETLFVQEVRTEPHERKSDVDALASAS